MKDSNYQKIYVLTKEEKSRLDYAEAIATGMGFILLIAVSILL